MSTKQQLIEGRDAALAAANALNKDEFIKNAKNNNAANKQADKDVLISGYDSQIDNTQKSYDKQIDDTNISYESEYERNAVQKLINERQIAEVNANLGLTDSGLNRTQQTAAQLSYANQKGKIDLAKRNALDNLNAALTSAITTLENEKASGVREIENYWDNLSTEQGTNEYNSKLSYYNDQIKSYNQGIVDIEKQEQDIANEQWKLNEQLKYNQWKAELDANTAIAKEQIAVAAKQPTVSYGAGGTQSGGYIISNKNGTLSRDYYGSLKDNGVDTVYSYNKDGTIKSVTYTDSNSGMSASFEAGVNPYTGKMHDDLRDENGKYDPSKAFRSNGYQPNNIGGKKLKATKAKGYIYPGLEQTVFECDGKAYLWDGGKGKYVQVTGEAFKEAFPSGKIE